jgi:hypothetical protein
MVPEINQCDLNHIDLALCFMYIFIKLQMDPFRLLRHHQCTVLGLEKIPEHLGVKNKCTY